MLLITGSNGQLGTELRGRLPDALCASRQELDITDAHAVQVFVDSHNVDTIINCAAYTAVDKAEDEPELAHAINALGPENLARTGCRIIHISTDYVFDGTSQRAYREDDRPHPLSVYGQTKLEGEQAVLEQAQSALVLRTSWLYSAHGSNFLKTMLRLGREKKSINVVSDQIGTPTWAGDLADAIIAILPKFSVGMKEIYHFRNEGSCSWYGFALEIMHQAGLPCDVWPIETKSWPSKACRPAFSLLNNIRIKQDFGLSIPFWKESLATCLKQF